MRKDNPEFPVGTVCQITNGSYKEGEYVTVCEWDLFEEEFSDLDSDLHKYVPVIEKDGKINGWYARNLRKVEGTPLADVPHLLMDDDEPKQETIEI